MKKKTEHFLLYLILIVGFVLRFFSAISHSYSSDELSAITRLKYDNLYDLLEYGVKLGDMHPAGVQIFMKIWSSIFGHSELAMRLPFVLLGTVSIWLIYKIGKYYSTYVGLFSAALWSILLFPIIQSELARPYSPGLFFILSSTVFLLKILNNQFKKRQIWLVSLGLGISLAGCMYTHYFAFLSVGFITLSALFWIKKSAIFPYFLSGVLAIILFLPHLSITLYQTGIDGGIQWLAPPGNWWLLEFLFFAFNNSLFLIVVIVSLIIIGIAIGLKEKVRLSKYTLLFLIWFFGTYIVGHLVSHYFTPVLKFPVMIFVLPFFILILAKVLSHTFKYLMGGIPFLIIGATAFSTIFEKKLFQPVHYEVFKELSQHIRDWESRFGENNIMKVMNISNPDYLNFYGLQSGKAHHLDLDLINYGDAKKLNTLLSNSKKEHLILGYSGRHTPIQFLNQSLKYYPFLVEHYSYNNSAIVLLSKHSQAIESPLKVLKTISFTDQNQWEFSTDKFNAKTMQYLADSNNVYRPQFILPINDALKANQHFLRITLNANINHLNQISLVAIPETKNGETINDNYGNPIYIGHDVEEDLLSFKKASFAFSVPPHITRNGRIKIYIWNRNKQPFLINEIDIEIIQNVWNN